jgi:DNA-binding transcriptional LysR family regulator
MTFDVPPRPFVVGLPREHLLAKETGVKAEHLWREDLLLLKDGHCLRDHALAARRLADRRVTEGFEATSLPTLVQMVDNGLGITLLRRLAVNAGLLLGTDLVIRPLLSYDPARRAPKRQPHTRCHTRPLSCFGCSGSLPVDPLAALGIFPRAGAVFERLAPFVIRKLALHR